MLHPLAKFVVGFAVAEIMALLWPVFALIAARPIRDGFRWICHSTTFGLHHHTLMAIAVGLFAAVFSTDFFTANGASWPRLYRIGAIGLLVIFAALAIGMAVVDSMSVGLVPCFMRDSDKRKEAYKLEEKFRKLPDPDLAVKKPEYNTDFMTYKSLIGLHPEKTMWTDGNALAYVSFFLNCVFGVFVASYLWYIFIVFIRKMLLDISVQLDDALIVIYLFLGLWFPLRIYATWYEKHFLGIAWLQTYGALVAMLMLYVLAGVVLAILYMRFPPWVAVLVPILTPVVSWLVEKVHPGAWRQVAMAIESLHWFYFVAVGFVFFVVFFMVALTILLKHSPNSAQ